MLLSSPVTLLCQDHVLFLVYPFSRSVVSSAQVLFILSSLVSLFNRSVVRICSSLFLFPNGEFFNFDHLRGIIPFKLFNFSRFFGFTSLSKKQLSFTSSLSLPFVPPVPFQISGRDPLIVVECCNAPRPELQVPSMFSGFRRMICLVRCIHLCIMCIASCHHATRFKKNQSNKPYGSLIHLNRGNSHGEFSL